MPINTELNAYELVGPVMLPIAVSALVLIVFSLQPKQPEQLHMINSLFELVPVKQINGVSV